MPVELTINNVSKTVDVEPDTPLLWVLRDTLNLHGTKYGCGMGLCGACTVIVAGQAIRSCLTQVSSVAGKPITTIEGLSPDGTHPVQKAWQKIDVPQCGYCQAGQIMSATALLSRTPHPTDADIDAAMSGNLCRCGTYPRIREAIHEAATLAKKHKERRRTMNLNRRSFLKVSALATGAITLRLYIPQAQAQAPAKRRPEAHRFHQDRPRRNRHHQSPRTRNGPGHQDRASHAHCGRARR